MFWFNREKECKRREGREKKGTCDMSKKDDEFCNNKDFEFVEYWDF